MRFVMFCHSLISDWNHGNAHFLRGVTTELLKRGHQVRVYEPLDAWSVLNLERDAGSAALSDYLEAYPNLSSTRYDLDEMDVDRVLAGADVVLVHEWNDPDLVAMVGEHRRENGEYALFFHDTHHRSVTAAEEMARYDLSGYDGVLAFSGAVADAHLRNGWAKRAWTWHEAADPGVFYPRTGVRREADLVWIGNWGDGERATELEEFLIEPVRRLRLSAVVHGVRYSRLARRKLADAGIEYRGWLPNYRVPEVFAAHRVTVHVPRRPYATALPGTPTIRVFEALACGMPLVSAPWTDSEGLFVRGRDFLMVHSGEEMMDRLQALLADAAAREALASHGPQTIRRRHTCAHRVEELLQIVRAVSGVDAGSAAA